MIKMKKRIAIVVTAAAMAATAVTGCGGVNANAVVAEIGDDSMTMGVANFFARYKQALTEAQIGGYFGPDFWNTKVSENETWEENAKKDILKNLEIMYVLEDHMKDYNVTLTDEETAGIEKAAKAFVKANGKKEMEAVSGDEETVKRVLTLITIQERMREAMIADVDTNVSDKEAAQKSMEYVSFPFSKAGDDGKIIKMPDEEKPNLKKEAEAFLEGAKKAEDFKKYAEEKKYTASTQTFDAKETAPAEALIKAADALKEGEFTDIIETDNGYYVAKLTSTFDKEATETEKKVIVQQRQNDRFMELSEKFLKEAKIKENKKEWNKISFIEKKITMKQTEQTQK